MSASIAPLATTTHELPLPFVVRQPDACRELVPALAHTKAPDVWVWEYTHPETGWTLSIATHAPPGSGKLSLGGFRIAPDDRASVPGYSNAAEAIGLAMGMEEKIRWSRLIRAGGPLAERNLHRLVGGKCVLLPTADARVGQPRDIELLTFAVQALNQFEPDSGIHVTTGQDLGHGILSDGVTPSLAFLHARFRGSVLADTSKPTAEGNWRLLRGMLRALGVEAAQARVGLVGVGNIGEHVLHRLRDEGVECIAVESDRAKRASLEVRGVQAWGEESLLDFLAQPMDAVVANARGGTFSMAACDAIARNARMRVVCGCENLVMPDPRGEELLRAAGKVYVPTEFGGMMGYLTAVEEYLAQTEGQEFDVTALFAAAERLEVAGLEATSRVRAGGYTETFAHAVEAIHPEH